MMRGARIGWEISQRDHDWVDEGLAWGFEMPAKAHPLLRRWGLRHLRSWIVLVQAYVFPLHRAPDWREMWRKEWVSYAIWRGWC